MARMIRSIPLQRLGSLGALIVVTLALAACRDDAPGRPDLVLITTDRLATEDLECFGGPSGVGSSVCALANRGTLFAWATTPGGGEAASAATALTGLPESLHGVHADGVSFLRDRHESVAEGLVPLGYSTGAFVVGSRLNRARRFDQGFARYDDRIARETRSGTPISELLAETVGLWVEQVESPYFAWIHAGEELDLADLDRLVARLTSQLDQGAQRPGILFAALRGREPVSEFDLGGRARVDWASHRIPLLWRPPSTKASDTPPHVSFRLVGLADLRSTLLRAGGAKAVDPTTPSLSMTPPAARNTEADNGLTTDPEERLLLLHAGKVGEGEVAIASDRHLYVRSPSLADGSGRPTPPTELRARDARFSTLQIPHAGEAHDASRQPGPWRTDVLAADSPVPRLEFHLARLLAERLSAPDPP